MDFIEQYDRLREAVAAQLTLFSILRLPINTTVTDNAERDLLRRYQSSNRQGPFRRLTAESTRAPNAAMPRLH